MASDTVEKPFIKQICSILSIKNKNKKQFSFKKEAVNSIYQLSYHKAMLYITFLIKNHPKWCEPSRYSDGIMLIGNEKKWKVMLVVLFKKMCSKDWEIKKIKIFRYVIAVKVLEVSGLGGFTNCYIARHSLMVKLYNWKYYLLLVRLQVITTSLKMVQVSYKDK